MVFICGMLRAAALSQDFNSQIQTEIGRLQQSLREQPITVLYGAPPDLHEQAEKTIAQLGGK